MGQFVTKYAVPVVLLLSTAISPGVNLRLDGDRVWMKAENETLYNVLAEFSRLGVQVQMDPGVRDTLSCEISNGDLEKELQHLLKKFGYVLTWSVLQGPVEPITRLDAIRVFRPGLESSVRPLDEQGGFRIAGGRGEPEYVADEILVGFKEGIDQASFRQFLARVGGTVVDSVPGMGLYRIRVPAGTPIPALVKQLGRDAVVASVEPNYIYRMPAEKGPPTLPVKADLSPAAKNTPALAVLDSGLKPDSGLDPAVVARLDALSPDQPISDPVGHGTQMSMVATGAVTPSGYTGSGGTVPLVAVRAFDEQGLSSNFDLIESMRFAVNQGARVVNMSWGTEVPSDFMRDTLQWVYDQNVVLVASAGNEPTGKTLYPASYDHVLGVSALNADQTLWEQSNRGDFVDLAAPGQAELPVGYEGPPGFYAGTSIASAYASRALALYFAEYPQASAAEASQALLAALTDTGSPGRDPLYGSGSLDDAALQKLLSTPPPSGGR